MTGFKFFVVVVLYQRAWSDSLAITTLLKSISLLESVGFNMNIYVWDNSPGLYPSLVHPSVTWLEGENTVLPVIYNHVAKLAFDNGAMALMISDDDTDYSAFNFEESLSVVSSITNNAIQARQVGCLIPRIRSANIFVSPGARFLFKGRLLAEVPVGLMSSKNLLAINSGTIITRACYERMVPLYNERLKFYGTDTDFFIRYEQYFTHVYVLESVVEHSLSEHTQESVDRALFRWKDNIEAIRVTFEASNFFVRYSMWAYHVFKKAKLFIKYRDIRFLKI
ncbi:MAG: hypothetical protein KJ930_08115 [Gammaproteobacteria bacterium]|nr:hypothetical protein [Gammaproteobacteria bacterium]MBU2064338.1 hypothetical protein [Gammaproteobacteria bacterium]MBU2179386.1 hypothetical protein [Gammaproteobacteria bacterium]MBU2255558.1 hypothetical protein [Gammaproteobacteria bacterium]